MTKTLPFFAVLVTALAALVACGGSSAASVTSPTAVSGATTTTPTTSGSSNASLTGIYSRFRSAVTVSTSGSTVTLASQDVPDHVSPYWGTGNALYEAPHAGMQVNPFRIVAQSLTMRVPAAPAVSGMTDTPLGPIGMAINGVALFNQYAAGRVPLTTEIVSFDRFNGHPSPSSQYHYHFEPVSITGGDPAGLVGVLLDGFPVYGPQDAGGVTPTNLDACNGHTGVTADAPAGVYHYHTTTAVPYIAGCFRGTAGSVG
jgi:hypothetical protein